LRRQSWEMPSGTNWNALEAACLGGLLEAVDELVRCDRVFNNARNAVSLSVRSGAMSQELLDEVRRAEAELHVAITMLASARGTHLEAKSQRAEASAGAAL
jgi:hypothetical protein